LKYIPANVIIRFLSYLFLLRAGNLYRFLYRVPMYFSCDSEKDISRSLWSIVLVQVKNTLLIISHNPRIKTSGIIKPVIKFLVARGEMFLQLLNKHLRLLCWIFLIFSVIVHLHGSVSHRGTDSSIDIFSQHTTVWVIPNDVFRHQKVKNTTTIKTHNPNYQYKISKKKRIK